MGVKFGLFGRLHKGGKLYHIRKQRLYTRKALEKWCFFTLESGLYTFLYNLYIVTKFNFDTTFCAFYIDFEVNLWYDGEAYSSLKKH